MICPACARKHDEVDGMPIAEYASAQASLLDLIEPFHCENCGSTAGTVHADRLALGHSESVCCTIDQYHIDRKPAMSNPPRREREGAAWLDAVGSKPARANYEPCWDMLVAGSEHGDKAISQAQELSDG